MNILKAILCFAVSFCFLEHPAEASSKLKKKAGKQLVKKAAKGGKAKKVTSLADKAAKSKAKLEKKTGKIQDKLNKAQEQLAAAGSMADTSALKAKIEKQKAKLAVAAGGAAGIAAMAQLDKAKVEDLEKKLKEDDDLPDSDPNKLSAAERQAIQEKIDRKKERLANAAASSESAPAGSGEAGSESAPAGSGEAGSESAPAGSGDAASGDAPAESKPSGDAASGDAPPAEGGEAQPTN